MYTIKSQYMCIWNITQQRRIHTMYCNHHKLRPRNRTLHATFAPQPPHTTKLSYSHLQLHNCYLTLGPNTATATTTNRKTCMYSNQRWCSQNPSSARRGYQPQATNGATTSTATAAANTSHNHGRKAMIWCNTPCSKDPWPTQRGSRGLQTTTHCQSNNDTAAVISGNVTN